MFCILVVLSLFLCCHAQDVVPKEYTVNLDLPEQDRWLNVINERKNLAAEIQNGLKLVLDWLSIPDIFHHEFVKLAGDLNKYLPSPFAGEIRGIAEHLNISVGDIVLPNVLYDFVAFCTSIVAEDSSGRIWHGRNLDFAFSDYLRNTTIIVHFQSKGKTLYTSTSYAGLVGVLTGQKPGVFTISLDERDKGRLWKNIMIAALDRKAKHPIFLIRQLLESASSYDEVINRLQNTDSISPVYYIVGGTKPGQGAVITKGHTLPADVWRLNTTADRWFLVETNYDHWKPPPAHDDRRHPAMRYMTAVGQKNVNTTSLYRVLSKPPLLRIETTYTTVMSAAFPDLYSTRIRHPKS